MTASRAPLPKRTSDWTHTASTIVPLPFAPPTPQKPKLLDELPETVRIRHYSLQTETTYRHCESGLSFFMSFCNFASLTPLLSQEKKIGR